MFEWTEEDEREYRRLQDEQFAWDEKAYLLEWV